MLTVSSEKLKTAWLFSFETAVRQRYGDRIPTIGLWVNAHMHHSQGKTVSEAVEAIGVSFRLKGEAS